MGFFEKYDADNLRDFAQSMLDLEFFFENREKKINTQCNPNLSFDGVFGSSIECFDPEMLFDPLEKQFHLPARLVELSYHERRKQEIVA